MPGKRLSRDAWICLALVASMQCLSMLDRNILAILNPRIKADLHIGDAEMGLLYGTVFALFYAVFSLPLGRLADGWRRGWLLAICITLWSLATGLAGFASGFALLAVSRLGVGIGEAAGQPAGTSLVFDYFPKNRRGLALAVMAAMLAAGLGLSSVLGGMAADGWDHAFAAGHPAPLGLKGWQFAFVLAALPGVPLAILLALMREPVRGLSDGIASRVDPAPFRASLDVLIAVLPIGVWWTLARRRAGSGAIVRNVLALIAITVVMVALARLCAVLSPRPPLHVLGLTLDPHALQWTIVGIGGYVVVNFLQSLRLADAPTHAVIMGSPALWLCLIVGSLQTTINYGVMGFTPAFLMKTWHLSAGDVGLKFGLLSAAIGMVGAAVRPAGSARRGRRARRAGDGGAGRVAVCGDGGLYVARSCDVLSALHALQRDPDNVAAAVVRGALRTSPAAHAGADGGALYPADDHSWAGHRALLGGHGGRPDPRQPWHGHPVGQWTGAGDRDRAAGAVAPRGPRCGGGSGTGEGCGGAGLAGNSFAIPAFAGMTKEEC